MNKLNLKHKVASVSKLKTNENNYIKPVTYVVSEGRIRSMVLKRIDELSLPPMRTLLDNKIKFKSCLTDRAAESINTKLQQPIHNRCGENNDSKEPHSKSCFSEPKYKRRVPIDKMARAKFLLQNQIKSSSTKPSRIDVLSKPLERRLPEPELENAITFNVKPSTLRYVANERILELAKPRKPQQVKVVKNKKKKKSVSRHRNRKRR